MESGDDPFYSCINCKNPLAFFSDLLSTSYKAKSGQAYLFSHAMNVVLGRKEDKQMLTGLFTIAQINCSKCGEPLGWKYVTAYDKKQRYKEGNFILEKLKIFQEN
ncbi:protein yippee-like At4g27745 [Mercurialis annua]|uniref:protein yippee-like At4g27745 n=1 Tax=Mercurialis annua TaxID=3986 RepID=UPI00215EF172|nr:protein yippee-like At4g27745 [Mercurialis annua]XP_050238645.1 protein yippee-like At4g27745 [Mercurialis annua]XP_050238646.1 protein yippee-like At4g27745 [Mercurialis annua]